MPLPGPTWRQIWVAVGKTWQKKKNNQEEERKQAGRKAGWLAGWRPSDAVVAWETSAERDGDGHKGFNKNEKNAEQGQSSANKMKWW